MKLLLCVVMALAVAACGGAPDAASSEQAGVVAGVEACGPLYNACLAAPDGVTSCSPEGNAWSCECHNCIGNNTCLANFCTYTATK